MGTKAQSQIESPGTFGIAVDFCRSCTPVSAFVDYKSLDIGMFAKEFTGDLRTENREFGIGITCKQIFDGRSDHHAIPQPSGYLYHYLHNSPLRVWFATKAIGSS